MEGGFEALPAAPLDEADEHEDAVSGGEFAFEFEAEAGLAGGVHDEAVRAERGGWRLGRSGWPVEGAEQLGWRVDGFGGEGYFIAGLCLEKGEEGVGEMELLLRAGGGRSRSEGRV